MTAISRRQFGRVAGAAGLVLAAGSAFPRPGIAQAKAKVVVVGGGPGGATLARYLAKDAKDIDVTLVEANPQYTTCFYSNLYIGGFRTFESITHTYDKLAATGVKLVHDAVIDVDAAGKTVTLRGGARLPYDRLVLAPGIDLKFDSVPGYGEAAAERMPHAWKAGAQTRLLKRQLEAMPDGGLFVMVAPPNPFRCPPGPYERISMVAHYFKTQKPKSKIIVFDPKANFSKQGLFEEGWKRFYPGMIDWVPADMGGKVTRVDPETLEVVADGQSVKAAVVNVVPAQRAGDIAQKAGCADASGWCPVDAFTMESRQQKGIHLVGDAIIPGDMPKSAFSANSQAKAAAMIIRGALTGAQTFEPRYRNTCWSLIASDYSVKIGANYKPTAEKLAAENPFVSQVGESDAIRAQTKVEGDGWYAGIVADVFG